MNDDKKVKVVDVFCWKIVPHLIQRIIVFFHYLPSVASWELIQDVYFLLLVFCALQKYMSSIVAANKSLIWSIDWNIQPIVLVGWPKFQANVISK